jgi:hypothetical protein
MSSPSSPGAFSDPYTRVRPVARRVEPRESCDLDFAGLGFGTGFGRTTVALGGADTDVGGIGSVGFGGGRAGTLLERVLSRVAAVLEMTAMAMVMTE